MAALHGIMSKDATDRGRHSTTAHRAIEARLQTWNGSITVVLDKFDQFEIYLGKHTSESSSPGVLVARGTVDPEQWDEDPITLVDPDEG